MSSATMCLGACHEALKVSYSGGAWVAQLVKCPTSAQVMILSFPSSRPESGSVLTVQSLKPVSYSVSPSPSLPLLCSCSVCLSLSLKNNKINTKKVSYSERRSTSCYLIAGECVHRHHMQGRRGWKRMRFQREKKSMCQFDEVGESEGIPTTCKEPCSARSS